MVVPIENSGSLLIGGSGDVISVDTGELVTDSGTIDMSTGVVSAPAIVDSGTTQLTENTIPMMEMQAMQSATIHSISGNGNWDNPLSWVEGRVPNSNDIVEINGNITLAGNPTIL